MQHLVPIDVWVPLNAADGWDKTTADGLKQRGARWLDVTVRLREGVDRQQAEAALSVVAAQLASEYPDTNRGRTVVLRPVDERGRATLGAIILSLPWLVLLIACANVAGILLARGEARRREFAMRCALGAGRGRLLRQLLAESLLLALAAGGLGLLLAHWLMQAIPAVLPALPITLDFGLRIDGRLLAYTMTLSLFTMLAAGLLPALRASRLHLSPALKGEASGGSGRSRLRGALLITQIAASQFLLAGTGLLIKSYFEVQRIRPGFDTGRHVLFASLLPNTEHPETKYENLLAGIRAVPGVRRVTAVRNPPLSGSGTGPQQVSIPGVTDGPVGIAGNAAGAEYFTAMGTAILSGRDFAETDSTGTAIVNEQMARRFWGDPGWAIGRHFRVDGRDRRIVGVIETGKYGSLLEPPMPHFFLFTTTADYLLIDTAATPGEMGGPIRKALRDAGSGMTLHSLVTLREAMGLAFFFWRSASGVVGIAAILGVFLAGVGLFGLVSYGVNRRAREIGVRMAMGARPADVLKLVLREGVSMVLIGAAIGTAGAIAAAELVSAFLYHVSPADPPALIASGLVIAGVTLLAIQVPARRAIRTDPMTVLRGE